VILTFDAGYLDFHTTAWPILRDYDLGATVFLVASMIGRSSVWDRGRGVEAPLMDWQRIRALRDDGVDFGSLTASHATLAALSHADVVRELTWSRALLERGIERSVDAVAYPYDRWDPSIAHLAGACGYVYGLTGRGGRSRLSDSALRLPRIEIRGEDGLADFTRKLFGRRQ
jgi:peptidoglycan/xylan/chitin deacetylase (PgdA/CDA1 family)